MSKVQERAHYMNDTQRDQMNHAPHKDGKPFRTHQNCKDATGVSRPGKTAQDRARQK